MINYYYKLGQQEAQLKLANIITASPVLAVPGAIAGSQRAHHKKHPELIGALYGSGGASLGGVIGSTIGTISGYAAGNAFHKLMPSAGNASSMVHRRRVLGGGLIGSIAGVTAGGLSGYELAMRRFERKADKIKAHYTKKHK
jgi:hypothetical protein